MKVPDAIKKAEKSVTYWEEEERRGAAFGISELFKHKIAELEALRTDDNLNTISDVMLMLDEELIKATHFVDAETRDRIYKVRLGMNMLRQLCGDIKIEKGE